MTVLGKIRNSIAHKSGHVVLRAELSKFGGPSQVSVAINTLISDGELVRIGAGVFVNAKRDADPDEDPQAIFQEVFDKLHVSVTFLHTKRHNGQLNCVVNTGKTRFSKPLKLGNYVLVYHKDPPKRQASPVEVPADLEQLPRKNVKQFVSSVAQSHNIVSKRSRLDGWAEAVTRAAGDSIELDPFGQTLLALFKAQLINGKQMSRLMSNYMLEKKLRRQVHQVQRGIAFHKG